jgi:ribosomal protein S18 acetylase RimI-like enzyme
VSVVDGALAARDLERLARMHVEAVPESLVSVIGERYARTFYRYVAASAEELLLTEREGGEIVAACLASVAPDTLSRRLLVKTPLALLAPFAVRRLPLRAILRGLGSRSAEPRSSGSEILLIFSAAGARSRGLGGRLLARCEALLAARGVATLHVKTRDDPANRALQFYERARFERVASQSKFGKRLALFEKSLRGSP